MLSGTPTSEAGIWTILSYLLVTKTLLNLNAARGDDTGSQVYIGVPFTHPKE